MAQTDFKPRIGVMGSAGSLPQGETMRRLQELGRRLGEAIAARGCIVVTGATTGLPDLVSRAARARGGLAVGISPAASVEEHQKVYGLPVDGVDVLIGTGFGLKGRNVINIRSSDVVIIFAGAMGALNEFTIAYDEGKIIGVLEGSGGIADHLSAIVGFADKPTMAKIFYEPEPERLLEVCLSALYERISTDHLNENPSY